jgi:hypothetical protein
MKQPKAFILGMHDVPGGNLSDFEGLGQVLRQAKVFPVIPHRLFDGYDDDTLRQYDAIRVLTGELIECDLIVTMKDWDLVPLNRKLVEIARICDIKIENYTKYLHPASHDQH